MEPEVPSRARRALPALRRSEKEDGRRPSEFLVLIMDGFWCLRCISNHIDLPNTIGLFAAGTTNPLVAKTWTKYFFYAFMISIAILWYLEAKFEYSYFKYFFIWVSQFYTQIFKSFWSKLKVGSNFSNFSFIIGGLKCQQEGPLLELLEN